MIKTIKIEKAHPTDPLAVKEFYLDAESDLSDLPTQSEGGRYGVCSTGSMAFVLTPGAGKSHLRILDGSGTWQEVAV